MDEAVSRIASGESYEKLADELGVEVKAVRGWVRKAERTQRVSTDPVASDAPGSPLLKALASAGLDTSEIPPIETAQTAAATEKTDALPPISGDQLMVMLEVVDRMTVSMICAAKAPKGVTKAEIERTIKLPAEDKAALRELAPYAADYLPAMGQYVKPAMALLFVGVWGFSVVTRLKAVQALAPREVKAT